ncbi:DUF4491 family protein [Lachnospiraceae bacterium C1.1]|nr:DUF4491 family protein [Lachnospiraceae bacterium C1.1]
MNFHIDGLIIGVFMLLCTGIFHPILGITCIWCIVELFEQEKRVERGWFPNGRKREKR